MEIYINQLTNKNNQLKDNKEFYEFLLNLIRNNINENNIQSQEWMDQFQWELFPKLLILPKSDCELTDDEQFELNPINERNQVLTMCFDHFSSMELLLHLNQLLKTFDLDEYDDFLGIFQWLDLFHWINQVLLKLRYKQFISNVPEILERIIETFNQIQLIINDIDPNQTILIPNESNHSINFKHFINQKIESNLNQLIQLFIDKLDLSNLEESNETKIINDLLLLYSNFILYHYGSKSLEFSSIYFTQSITDHYKLIDSNSIQTILIPIYSNIIKSLKPILPFQKFIIQYLLNGINNELENDSSMCFTIGLIISVNLTIDHLKNDYNDIQSMDEWTFVTELNHNNYFKLSNQLIKSANANTYIGYIDILTFFRLKYLLTIQSNQDLNQFNANDSMMDFIMFMNLHSVVKERKLNLIIFKSCVMEYNLFNQSDQLSILNYTFNNAHELNLTQVKNCFIPILKEQYVNSQFNMNLNWVQLSNILLLPISKLSINNFQYEMNFISLLLNLYIFLFQKFNHSDNDQTCIKTDEHIKLVQINLIEPIIQLIKLIEFQNENDITMELILDNLKLNINRLTELTK